MIILMVILLMTDGSFRVTPSVWSSMEKCKAAGPDVASTALDGENVAKVKWKCERGPTFDDAPPADPAHPGA